MKKFIIIVLAIIAIILVFCLGYFSKNYDNNSSESQNSVEIVDNTLSPKNQTLDNLNTNSTSDTPTTEKSSDLDLYADVLDAYKKAMAEYDPDALNEEVEKKYEIASPTLLFHVNRFKSNGVKLTYVFYDIDENGTDELIMGADGAPGAIYSYDKSKNKPVKIFFQDTMERGELLVFENGVIESNGSGGATSHYFEFGKISDNGTSYDKLEAIDEEYESGSDTPTYKDPNTGKALKYKSMDEITDKYLSNATEVEFTNYSEL